MVMHFKELPSTSSYLKEHIEGLPGFSVVRADYQTAGRGQRGNHWESESGSNLLMSMLFCPPAALHPSAQFLVSKAVSLAVLDVVDKYLGGLDVPEACVKWPNDIYVGDRKVAGILIENALQSADRIAHTVIGVGLNVNQRRFLSDAPNPASLAQYFGKDLPVNDVCAFLVDSLKRNLACLPENAAQISSRYKARLWRREGFHRYISRVASSSAAPTAVTQNEILSAGSCFEAEIIDVAADGPLSLRLRSGEVRVFNFKEVVPVIDNVTKGNKLIK